MRETILVAVAWPYANADIHVGNIAGAYLPADIFARYHRLAGNRVLMVSGSDAHGTPITLRAEREGTSPKSVCERYHRRHVELFQRLGISYDLYTTTHSRNHFRVAQDVFLRLREQGALVARTDRQWYSPGLGRFLPDRYVEGQCSFCGFPSARSDQCDDCGRLLDPSQLVEPRAAIGGGAVELRDTEHYHLDLPQFRAALDEYLHSGKDHWRPNVLHPSQYTVALGELHSRPITRDLEWGIPVPLQGWEGKCLYVWFEAVIGYLSSSIEWAAQRDQPEAWKAWWYEPDARSYYFIGKDNIPFHTLIWPAELMGIERLYEDDHSRRLNLPYDVPANEFLNLEGRRISGSRNWAVWGIDALDRYDPDPLRYYLTAVMPESGDSDWEWDGFVRHNDELLCKLGNLANRVLTFAYKHWAGQVPHPSELRPQDRGLLCAVEAAFDQVGGHLQAVRLRAALREVVGLATRVNRYLDRQQPWFEVKRDPGQAATTIFTALKAIDSLHVLFAPFLPFTSERLRHCLGYEAPLFGTSRTITVRERDGSHVALTYDSSGATGRWAPGQLAPGQALGPPEVLFQRLGPETVEAERHRLEPTE